MSRTATRRAELLRRVRAAGELGFTELAEQLAVSEMTVRRDAHALESDGLLRRVHGGVIVNPDQGGVDRLFAAGDRDLHLARTAIAAVGATLVGEGEAVALGAGTAVVELARVLVGRDDLTVVTSGLAAMTVLAGTAGPHVLATGGLVEPGRLGLVGDRAEAGYDGVNCDIAFLSADGIGGIGSAVLTSSSEDEARVAAAAVRSARRRVVLADRTTLGRTELYTVVPLTAVDVLVTDAEPDSPLLEPVRAAGVEVLVAGGVPAGPGAS